MEDKSILLNATLDSKIGEDVFINHEVNKHKILEDYSNKLIRYFVRERINNK